MVSLRGHCTLSVVVTRLSIHTSTDGLVTHEVANLRIADPTACLSSVTLAILSE